MEANHLMLQSALNRLQFWQGELKAALTAGDAKRIETCARFVEEYGVLIADMGARLYEPDARGPD
jgi:hypothetical protein